MTILCNDLTLEQINAALLRIQRSIQTGNNNFQNDVEKAVANVTISGKTTLQRYDDSRLMAIVNELNQRYENLTREQSDLRTKIVSLETILSNVSLGYDPSSNTISYTLGDYSTDVQLKDTTYTFSYDTDTGTFTIVDEYTGETVLNQVFNDTTYTFSFANGILTVHNNRLNTDQTFNFDSRYYTESEIQSLILDKIPSEASSSNQLADKAFVNSSISTATATFRGTVTTTQALAALTGDLNDYAFLQNIDPVTGQTISYDRYKWVETGGDYGHWKYEYTLNNSSFTSDQWAAINSGITCQIVTDLLDGCYTGHGSALCKSNGNEWRNLLATNCDCTEAVDADYIYYNTNVRVNQCNGLLSANCYCVLGRGYLPYAMCNLTASSLGLTAGCCYSITCILDMLRCCFSAKPGTYVFQYANAANPIVCETSGYAYCLSFTKLDAVNVPGSAWQKDHWIIEDNTTGKRWTASSCSAATAGTWTWSLNSNLTACKIYRNPACDNVNYPLFFAGATTAGFGNAYVSSCCQATFNPATGLLSAGALSTDSITSKKYITSCGSTCCMTFPTATTTYVSIGCIRGSQFANENRLGITLGGNSLVNTVTLNTIITTACAACFCDNNIEIRSSNYESTCLGIRGIGFVSTGSVWNCYVCVVLEICNSSSSDKVWCLGIFENQVMGNFVRCIQCLGTTAPTFACKIDIPYGDRGFTYSNAFTRIGANTTIGVPSSCTSTCAGCPGIILYKGGMELLTNTPYIDFHHNKYCGDYSARLINDCAGRVVLNVNNGTGCTEATANYSYAWCSDGTFTAKYLKGLDQYHCRLPSPNNTLTYATIELENDGWQGESLCLDVNLYGTTYHAAFRELGCCDTASPNVITITQAWYDNGAYGLRCFGRSSVAGDTCRVFIAYVGYRPSWVTSNKRIKCITRSTTAPENVCWCEPKQGAPFACICRCATSDDASYHLLFSCLNENQKISVVRASSGCSLTYNPSTGVLSACVFEGNDRYHCTLASHSNTVYYATIELSNSNADGDYIDFSAYHSLLHFNTYIESGKVRKTQNAWYENFKYAICCVGTSTCIDNNKYVYVKYGGYTPIAISSCQKLKSVTTSTTAPENVCWVEPTFGAPYACFCRCPVSSGLCYVALSGANAEAKVTNFQVTGASAAYPLQYCTDYGRLLTHGICTDLYYTNSCCKCFTPGGGEVWIHLGTFTPGGTSGKCLDKNDLTISASGVGMVSTVHLDIISSNVNTSFIRLSKAGYYGNTGISCVVITKTGDVWNCYNNVYVKVKSYTASGASTASPFCLNIYRNNIPPTWTTCLTYCQTLPSETVLYDSGCLLTYCSQAYTSINGFLEIGTPKYTTSSEAGCAFTRLSKGSAELSTSTPYLDFHYDYYCGDYSHRILGHNGALCFCVNNGRGCTAATQTGTFCMCSDGYFYGNVCGNLCGNATNSSKVYKTLASADVARQLLLGKATEAAGYGCVYASNGCKVTFNPGTGLLDVHGNVQSWNTLRRSSVYSSNTYSSGWYLVAQLSSKENGSGNHDITLGGYVDMTCGATPNLRRFCFKTTMRGNKCTVKACYAFIEPYGASDYLRVTRDVNTTDCTFTLRVYAKICGNYTRMNTTIDYYGGGDVNASRGLNSSAITFPNTYVADEASMTGTQITLNCGVGTLRANDIHVGYVQCASCSYVRINCNETTKKIQINGAASTDKGFILTTENCTCGCYNIGMEIGSGNVNRGIYHCNPSGTFQWLQYWDASNEIHNCPAKFTCSVCAGGNITTPSGVYSAWYYTCPTAKTCSFAANSKTYFLLGCFQPNNNTYANNVELGFAVGGGNLVSKGSIKALLTTASTSYFDNNSITVDYSNYQNTKYGVNAVGFTSSGNTFNCCIGVWLEICNPSSSACSWNVTLFRNLLSCTWSTCMTCTTTAPTFVCCIPVTCNRRNTHFNNSDVTLCRLTTTEKCTAPIMLTCSIPTVSSAYFLLGCYVVMDKVECRNELNLAFNVNQGMNLNTVGNLNLLLSNGASYADIFSTNIIDLNVSEPWGNGTRRLKSVGFTTDGSCVGVWIEVYNGYDSAMNFDVSLLPNLVANGWTSCLCCQATAPTFICCIPVPTGDKMPFHYSNVGGSSSWKSVYCGCRAISAQCQYLIMKAGPINASTVGKLDFLLCTSVDGTDYPSKICGTLMPGNAGTDAYNPDLINASFTSTRCALYPLSIGLDSTCCLVFAFAYQCGCTFRPQLFFKNDQFNEALGSISTSFLCCDSDPTTYRTYIMANMSCQCDSGMFVTSVNANQVTATCLSTYSKRSLKKDITPYTGCALNLIGNTNVVSYRYKTEDKNSLVHIGFIADDTPELLSGENKDTMRINDSVGLLLKAVQELDERTLPFWKKITNIVRKLIRRFRNGKKD